MRLHLHVRHATLGDAPSLIPILEQMTPSSCPRESNKALDQEAIRAHALAYVRQRIEPPDRALLLLEQPPEQKGKGYILGLCAVIIRRQKDGDSLETTTLFDIEDMAFVPSGKRRQMEKTMICYIQSWALAEPPARVQWNGDGGPSGTSRYLHMLMQMMARG